MTRGAVVVGVDGSPGAREALRWAIAEARLRKTRLRAVHAWRLGYGAGPGYVGSGYGYLAGGPGQLGAASLDEVGADVSSMREAAEELLESAIAELSADAGGVEIERHAVEGGAAQVLVDAVAADDLLVVGSRGHGGFAGLLLGSVSQQCAHHAPCPVVIVHARKASAGGSGAAG